jgi:hypothetical protein
MVVQTAASTGIERRASLAAGFGVERVGIAMVIQTSERRRTSTGRLGLPTPRGE